jgi:hypothetical protein
MAKDKVIIFFQGGLGNQLFQFCYGLDLESRFNTKVKYSTLLLDIKIPGVTKRKYELDDLTLTSQRVGKFISLLHLIASRFRKNGVATDLNFRENRKFRYALGYFQDYNQVDRNWNALRARLNNSQKFKKLFIAPGGQGTYICIHVRRGDYLNSMNSRAFHGLLKFDYFLRCVSKIEQHHNFTEIRIITDEPTEVMYLVNKLENKDYKVKVVGKNEVEDLKELVSSGALILSNSSFSWWGGFFASKLYASDVYAPEPWVVNKNYKSVNLKPKYWFKETGEFI